MSVWTHVRSYLIINLTDLIGEVGRPTEMFFAWVKNSKLSWLTLIEKVWFAGKAGFPGY